MLLKSRQVAWFSAGVSSAIACFLQLKVNPNLEIFYIHVDNQHEDTMRFVKDCEIAFNKEIKILQSPYRNIKNVIKQFRYINGVAGARCTQVLKKRVRKEWENDNSVQSYVWGFDCTKRELNRAERVKEYMPRYNHIFPLIQNNINKDQAHCMLKTLNIKRPKMYDLGYPNNNCVGCVKGGKGYWNKIRDDFPDTFKEMSKLEREIGASCINGTYLDSLDMRAGNKLKIILEECGEDCNYKL